MRTNFVKLSVTKRTPPLEVGVNNDYTYAKEICMNTTNDNTNEQSASNKAEPGSERQTDQIKQIGSIVINNKNHSIYCITIIGEVEGHCRAEAKNKTTKYEHVIPQLVSAEESDDIDGLLILLNTIGGDIEAGLALAELIAGMKKPTVSLILGGGHSIGVPLAVSAKKSFIVKSATMTIHPVRTSGTIIGVPQSFENFKRMQNRITDFVTSNSNISKDRFLELLNNKNELPMDVGTVLDGKNAVKEGLIDKLGSLSDALAALSKMIEKNK